MSILVCIHRLSVSVGVPGRNLHKIISGSKRCPDFRHVVYGVMVGTIVLRL